MIRMVAATRAREVIGLGLAFTIGGWSTCYA
jgi:hypothetical protein